MTGVGIGRWALSARRPLAFGGWVFSLTGPDSEKHVEWWPGDKHLSWQGRPFLSAPVPRDDSRAARGAVEALVDLLNEEEAA